MTGRFTTLAVKLSDLERSAEEDVVVRLWMLLLAVVAGGALALGATFTVTSVLAGSNESPVNQPIYHYGQR